MASTTFTLTANQLLDYVEKRNTLERTPEYRQLIKLMRQFDLQYLSTFGVTTYGLNPNALDGHTVNTTTGVVTVNTADANGLHEFPFFR